MKDRPDRAARLQLIGRMLAGQFWQTAVAESQLPIARTTAYRLVQYAHDEDNASQIFLDDRHGHPYKLTSPMQAWISEVCTGNMGVPSSSLQSELKIRFGVAVSVSQINWVRVKLGVSNQGKRRAQGLSKKTEDSSPCLPGRSWQLATVGSRSAHQTA